MPKDLIIDGADKPVRALADAYVEQRAPGCDGARHQEIWESFMAGFTSMFGMMLAIGFDPDPDNFARTMFKIKRELEEHGAVIELVDVEPDPMEGTKH